jgi:hypothetical protein
MLVKGVVVGQVGLQVGSQLLRTLGRLATPAFALALGGLGIWLGVVPELVWPVAPRFRLGFPVVPSAGLPGVEAAVVLWVSGEFFGVVVGVGGERLDEISEF